MRENTQGNDGIKYLRAERHDISNYKGLCRNTPGSNNFKKTSYILLTCQNIKNKEDILNSEKPNQSKRSLVNTGC